MIWAVQKFHVLLNGREITLQTDLASLAYMNKAKVTNSRVLRWSLILQEYRFRIKAIKGTPNVCADYSSRIDQMPIYLMWDKGRRKLESLRVFLLKAGGINCSYL